MRTIAPAPASDPVDVAACTAVARVEESMDDFVRAVLASNRRAPMMSAPPGHALVVRDALRQLVERLERVEREEMP